MSVNKDLTSQNNSVSEQKKKRCFLSPEQKLEILMIIEQAKEKGLSVTRISDGVGTSVICQLMKKEFFFIYLCFSMSILVKPSLGYSVGVKALKKIDVLWKKV